MAFLKSSKHFKTFIRSHDLEHQQLDIANNTNQQHIDIGEMLIGLLNDFIYELEEYLRNEYY